MSKGDKIKWLFFELSWVIIAILLNGINYSCNIDLTREKVLENIIIGLMIYWILNIPRKS